MSFFKSIGKIFKKVAAPVASFFGGDPVSALLPLAGDIVGSAISSKGQQKTAAADSAAAENINSYNVASQEKINAQNLALQREQMAREEALQREFATMGTQWKVADAKKAGLHPLFAIGGSGATYSPSVALSAGQAPQKTAIPRGKPSILEGMGQGISAGVRAMQTAEQRALTHAQLAQAAAATDLSHAQAEYYRSEARRGMTDVSSVPWPDYSTESPRGMPLTKHFNSTKLQRVKVNATQPGRSHIQAGTHAAFVEWNIGNGVYILAPYSDEGLANALGETPKALWPALMEANRKRYGDKAAIDILRSAMPYDYKKPLRQARSYVRKGVNRLMDMNETIDWRR